MAGHAQPAPHTWHHIACELDPEGLGMWYDGKLSYWYGTQQGNAGYPTHYDHDGSPLVLGQGDGASPKPVDVESVFAGAIDEVRFSDQRSLRSSSRARRLVARRRFRSLRTSTQRCSIRLSPSGISTSARATRRPTTGPKGARQPWKMERHGCRGRASCSDSVTLVRNPRALGRGKSSGVARATDPDRVPMNMGGGGGAGGGGGGTSTPVALTELANALSNALCGNLGSCCARAGYPFEADACNAYGAQLASAYAALDAAKVEYDPMGRWGLRCGDHTGREDLCSSRGELHPWWGLLPNVRG